MTIAERISSDLTQAMKERDAIPLGTLRMVKSALKNQEIEVGGPLDDEAAVKVLTRLCNQRRESIVQFEKGGRADLAERERAELSLIESYMPMAPDDAEIDAAVREAIEALHATSAREMGAVMKEVLGRFKGRPVDGKAVNQRVRQALGA